MRALSKSLCAAAAAIGVVAALAGPASAACTRLGFSVNDYGKDGPTNDAKDLLDKYIAKTMGERGISNYRTGKKDVTCELFLNFIVFDEHTCRADATVCWDDTPLPKGEEAAASTPASPAKKPATKTAKASPAAAPAKPVTTEAAKTEAAPAEAKTEAAKTEAAPAEAAKSEAATAATEPVTEPVTEPAAAVTEPSKPEPVKSETPKPAAAADTVKTESSKHEPAKTEAVNHEPAKAAPVKTKTEANATTTGSIEKHAEKKAHQAPAVVEAKSKVETYSVPSEAEVSGAAAAPAEPAAADDVPPVEAVAP